MSSRYIPWAELLKMTFGIDLSTCPKCGGMVRVIAAIMDTEAIAKILDHVGQGSNPPQMLVKSA